MLRRDKGLFQFPAVRIGLAGLRQQCRAVVAGDQQLTEFRQEYAAPDDDPVFRISDGNAPQGTAVDEIGGPVDRIDDPDPAVKHLVDQLVVVAFLKRFLAEQIFRAEFAVQQSLDRLIGIGNRGAVILDLDLRIGLDPPGDPGAFRKSSSTRTVFQPFMAVILR